MEVKKILWPTDFSSVAEKALPHVKSLTEQYGAEIHVLYVIEDVAHHDGWYGAFEAKRVQELGFDIVASAPAEFAAQVKSEIEKWGKVIKASGLKAE